MKARGRVSVPNVLSIAAPVIFVVLSALGAGSDSTTVQGGAPEQPPTSNGVISPQAMADSLHLVIAADREMYCKMYVERMTGDTLASNSGAHGKAREPLPMPFEMFQRTVESTQSKGAEFSFALRSLHPIDPRNGPQTELERSGLEFIAGHPDRNFYGREMLGGRRYVTAVYPDLPAAAACVDCHNQSAASTRHRFHVGDIMGGIVVRVPLEF